LLAANQFTGASRFESLLRSTVCLHLGHNNSLSKGVRGGRDVFLLNFSGSVLRSVTR
jgi:hypothetical protein